MYKCHGFNPFDSETLNYLVMTIVAIIQLGTIHDVKSVKSKKLLQCDKPLYLLCTTRIKNNLKNYVQLYVPTV